MWDFVCGCSAVMFTLSIQCVWWQGDDYVMMCTAWEGSVKYSNAITTTNRSLVPFERVKSSSTAKHIVFTSLFVRTRLARSCWSCSNTGCCSISGSTKLQKATRVVTSSATSPELWTTKSGRKARKPRAKISSSLIWKFRTASSLRKALVRQIPSLTNLFFS